MYEISNRVRFSDIGENGYLMIHQLINYFQDCSTFHLEDLQIDMPKPNLAFYMLSWQIEINRLPKLGEYIKVGTLMHEGKGAFGYRNYALYDDDNQMLAYANMIGCFIDIETEDLVKLTPEERAIYPLEEKLNMNYLPRRIRVPSFDTEHLPIVVGRSHIDINHHVNNAQYAAIALSYIPQNWEFSQIRIEYKKAAKNGDVMIPKSVEEKGVYYLALCDENHQPYVVFSFSQKEAKL